MTRLDHLVLPVADLDTAAATLAESGFVVTPEAAHPFGTANRLVVFEGVYLELVAVAQPDRLPVTGFARLVADHLEAGRTGFSHLACRAESLVDAGSAISNAGMEAGEPMWFSRPAPRSDGSQSTAGFTLLPIVGHPQQFFCVHHTPEAVWFAPHLRHPNGVTRIDEVRSSLTPAVPIADVAKGRAHVRFDTAVEPFEIAGVGFE